MANLVRVLRTAALIAILVVAFLWVFTPWGHPAAGDRAKVSRVYNDMRTVSIGLDAYHLDHGAYPAPVASKSGWTVLPAVLTTPVAYISHLPRDVFESGEGTYGYALIADDPAAWGDVASDMELAPEYVLLSQGPRRKREEFALDWGNVYDPTNGTKSGGYVFRFGEPATVEDSTRSGQNMHGRVKSTGVETQGYDPTNGTITRCEGWSVKQ